MAQDQPTIRTILCATDFSENATVALRQAAALAWQHGATLVLAHAVEPPTADPYPLAMSVGLGDGELRVRVEERVDALAESIGGEGFDVETIVEQGTPGRVLVELADRVGADLLVLGTRGLTGLEHLLLGSTAEYVVRRARCPVLTIHPEDHASVADAKTVLVPTDLSEDAAVAVEAFARLFPARVTPDLELVYVDATPPYLECMTHERLARHHQDDPRLVEIEERLAPLAEGLAAEGFRVVTRVLDGPAVEAITRHAESRGVDLVVMSTHGRSAIVNALLGRTAQRVVQRAPCPVLTVCPKGRRTVGVGR